MTTTTKSDATRDAGQTYSILKGHGYWDTTKYPVGGCFKRSDGLVSGTLLRVIDRFVDSLPRTVELKLSDGRMAVVSVDALGEGAAK